MSVSLAIIGMAGLIVAGAWAAAVLDRVVPALIAGRTPHGYLAAPLRSLAADFLREGPAAERPDALNWALAPCCYLALAVIGLSVVPLAPGVVAADFETGIVLWGACEALTVVVIFLHGWSANAPFPLIGGYRYVAIGLPVMLLSMFVLIAAALPAESLAVTDIVESQRAVWNIVRQPPGFVLFLMLGLALTLRGPFDYADPFDLSGGTMAEMSGPARAVWQGARLAMLVSVSAMAATVFLGGYLGPFLPGPVWLAIKTALVLALLVLVGNLVARLTPSRMLTALWVVLLPAAFLDLLLVGVEALP